jgi:hypothetical protein
MLFGYVYTLPNGTTLDTIGIQTVTAVPEFTPLLLLFVYFLVMLGGTARQKLSTGSPDFAMWSTIAGVSALIIALIMSTVTGLISLEWLVITFVVTAFSGVWFFISQRQSEV